MKSHIRIELEKTERDKFKYLCANPNNRIKSMQDAIHKFILQCVKNNRIPNA